MPGVTRDALDKPHVALARLSRRGKLQRLRNVLTRQPFAPRDVCLQQNGGIFARPPIGGGTVHSAEKRKPGLLANTPPFNFLKALNPSAPSFDTPLRRGTGQMDSVEHLEAAAGARKIQRLPTAGPAGAAAAAAAAVVLGAVVGQRRVKPWLVARTHSIRSRWWSPGWPVLRTRSTR